MGSERMPTGRRCTPFNADAGICIAMRKNIKDPTDKMKATRQQVYLPEGGLDVAALPEVCGDVPLCEVPHVNVGINCTHPIQHVTEMENVRYVGVRNITKKYC